MTFVLMNWFTETLRDTAVGYVFVLNLCPWITSRLRLANAVGESTKSEKVASGRSPDGDARISFSAPSEHHLLARGHLFISAGSYQFYLARSRAWSGFASDRRFRPLRHRPDLRPIDLSRHLRLDQCVLRRHVVSEFLPAVIFL